MVKDRLITSDDPKKRVNKSTKRECLVKDVVSDVKLDRRNGRSRKKTKDKTSKPTIKSVDVTSSKLIGHYTTDIDGKNLEMDEPGGIRIYSLPVEYQQISGINDTLSDEEVVDDWEQLTENKSSYPVSPHSEVFIPRCHDLSFNLLKGYIPVKDGGNPVGFAGRKRDRTNGMKWMVKHYNKLKCEDGSRLFDVDFNVGNGAIRKVMTSQNDIYVAEAQIAVILFMGTYFIWDVTPSGEETELNNKRSFGGLRFEDFVSRGIDGKENEPSSGDKNNYADSIKYYNVVQLNFAGYKMLLCGEVDCVIPGSSAARGKKPNAGDFIEVKTSAPLEDKYDKSYMSQVFRSNKTISWFAQCILMGVKHVVVGIRTEDGEDMICESTHSFNIEDLRNNSGGFWSKNRCFDALKKFLGIVKEKITDDNPEVINVFTVKEGVVTEPVKKTLTDDENLPDISEVVGLFKNLNL